MTLGFNRIPILTEKENELAFQEILGMKNIWFSRTNWHPAVEIGGENRGIEDYVHYYTVGATLYMDCLLYTSPSPRDGCRSRMPSSA